MQENGRASHFFLSANTPQGLVSHPEQLYSAKDGWRAFILKGGPGTGKSFFIEKVGKAMQQLGLNVEYIHCTSDSDSYDGLAVPPLKVCLLDGTPPHAIEPKYPGAVESIINLGECCDENALARQHDKIIVFAARISAIYDRAFRFLGAAGSLQADIARQAYECADLGKMERYATRLAKREFPPRRRQGRESQRFLTGITPGGVVFYKDTVSSYEKIFVIEDDFGLGRFLLARIRAFALSMGYDVISCNCPMSPADRLEHLLVPALSIAFVTSNRFHKLDFKGCRHIHIRRFIDNETLKLRRQRIVFNRKAARELIAEAIKLLGEARASHDILKDIYASATDFSAVDHKADDLTARLTRLHQAT